MGNSGYVEKIPAIKWSLNVLIVLSAALLICVPGGGSWKLISLYLSSLWKAGEVSLSSLVYAILIPLVSRCSCRYFKTQMNLLSDLAFMGRIKILFLLYLYSTNRYFFTLFYVTGNLPVKYDTIFLL